MSIEGVELHADRNRKERSNHMARRRSWEGSVRTQIRLENSANSDRNLRKRCCSTLPGKQSQMASKPHPGVAIVRLSSFGELRQLRSEYERQLGGEKAAAGIVSAN